MHMQDGNARVRPDAWLPIPLQRALAFIIACAMCNAVVHTFDWTPAAVQLCFSSLLSAARYERMAQTERHNIAEYTLQSTVGMQSELLLASLVTQ